MRFSSFTIALSITLFSIVFGDNGNIAVKEYDLDTDLFSDGFRWISNGVALLLTKSRILYRSTDDGVTWKECNLPHSSSTERPFFIYDNPIATDNIFISGTTYNWISDNGGADWTAVTADKPFFGIRWHPVPSKGTSKWALALSGEDGEELHVTKDGGATWTLISNTVINYGFDWGDAGTGNVPVDRVYFVEASSVDPRFPDFVQVNFDTNLERVVVQLRSYTFLFMNKLVFALIILPNNGYDVESILKVSPNLGQDLKVFYEAEFPFGNELEYNAYSILDDATGTTFVGVNHGSYDSHWGNVYNSDSLGYRYVTSLLHVRMENYNYDFERVKVLNGIFIANAVQNYQQQSSSTSDIIQTFISFDNGGEWRMIDPPHYDSQDQPILCPGQKLCKLHLHGYTSFDNGFGPFYSTPNAVGIIIATGNAGEALSFDRSEINTYMSRDGGLTWIEVMKGSTVYEVADHGGVILFAPLGETTTTTAYYTLTEGTTPVVPLTFTNDPVEVINIITDESFTSTKFIILAERKGAGTIFSVDFTKVYNRACTANDYEEWAPSDGDTTNGMSCLLGKDITYKRKKPDANCWNGDEKEPVSKIEYCACTEEDWECDYGYDRGTEEHTCVRVLPEETYPPAYCPAGTYYNKTKGYRKVAGDECRCGVDHSPSQDKCPGNAILKGKSNIAAAVLIPLAIVIIIVAAIVAMRSEKLRDKIPLLKMFHDWKDSYLGLSSRPGSLFDQDELESRHQDDDDLGEPDSPGVQIDLDDEPPMIDTQTDLLDISSNNKSSNHVEDPFDPRAN